MRNRVMKPALVFVGALVCAWTTFYYQLRPNWETGEISCSGDYLDFPGL